MVKQKKVTIQLPRRPTTVERIKNLEERDADIKLRIKNLEEQTGDANIMDMLRRQQLLQKNSQTLYRNNDILQDQHQQLLKQHNILKNAFKQLKIQLNQIVTAQQWNKSIRDDDNYMFLPVNNDDMSYDYFSLFTEENENNSQSEA
tara:strand:- start:25 stop:462 length:438 start_codon:yes stop_codon:yes gene_type:complete